MPTTNYYTVNGEIIGEHTTGQSRLDYIPDGQGSVAATIDQTLIVQSTARYKPFGGILSASGIQPAFGWIGTLGSRTSSTPHADFYNRARTLAALEGRWTTVDPLWPWEPAYAYARSCPTTLTDPSGFAPGDCPADVTTAAAAACDALRNFQPPSNLFNQLNRCMQDKGHKNTKALKDLLKCMSGNCGPTKSNPGIKRCIVCFGSSSDSGGLSSACGQFNPCEEGANTGVTSGFTPLPVQKPLPAPPKYPGGYYYGPGDYGDSCGWRGRNGQGNPVPGLQPCVDSFPSGMKDCTTVTFLCSDAKWKDQWQITLMHEMAHSCGLTHGGIGGGGDYITDLECCMCKYTPKCVVDKSCPK